LIQFPSIYSTYEVDEVPVKIIHSDHVEIIGVGRVLLAAPHATSPESDLHTGTIVEEAALTSRSYAVIGKVNKEFLDSNRIQSAQSELRKSIDRFVAEDGIRYVLVIHGKEEPGVDITTVDGSSGSESTTELVKSMLINDFTVSVNKEDKDTITGGVGTGYNDEGAKGDSVAVEKIHVRFGAEERQFQRERVIRDISEIADILNARVVESQAD
jgi:hypothetical protein